MTSVPDAFVDLDETLTDDLVEDPRDLDQVNRMLRALRRIEADRANVVTVAEAEAARIIEWMDIRTAELDARADAIRERLARYHEAILAEDPRRKTISTPNGTLSARSYTTWDYTDEGAFLAWAAEHCPEVIRQKEPVVPPPEIDRNAVKRLLVLRDERDRIVKAGIDPTTGEAPPGLVVHAGTTYSVSTSSEGESA